MNLPVSPSESYPLTIGRNDSTACYQRFADTHLHLRPKILKQTSVMQCEKPKQQDMIRVVIDTNSYFLIDTDEEKKRMIMKIVRPVVR